MTQFAVLLAFKLQVIPPIKIPSNKTFNLPGSDFFETVAKFRLARKMSAKIAKEKFGAKTKRATQLKIWIRTSGISLTSQKPLDNAARVTLQILSCVLGGVNSVIR